MSEVFRRLWLGVALIAASSAFLLLSDTSRVSTIPHVAVLQFSSMQALDDGARGLLDYLKEHGYDGTRNAVIERFNAENDVATSNAMAREITSGRYQYVISISTNCLQAVANANRAGKAKHLFGVVADPVAAKVGINPKDPADHPKHMTGIGSLMPSAVVGEVTSALISRGADVIVVIGDVTVGLAIDSVIAQARKGKIPVIGALPDYVSRGALFAAGADFYEVGRQMGEVALRMLHGDDPAQIPIIYSLPKAYGVNLAALNGLKDRWQVPPDLLAKANTVVDASGVRVNRK
jgi:putative ABC transport system substrate-binding protein